MKGQVSIYLIAVVVIIIIALAGYYVTQLSKEGEMAITKVQLGNAARQAISDYVNSCISETAKEGLLLFGMQGGHIYSDQGGLSLSAPMTEKGETFVTYQDSQIPYGLIRPKGSLVSYWFFFPPLYPWKTFPEIDLNGVIKVTSKGIFGVNRFFKSDLEGDLASYLLKRAGDCLDFAQFEAQNLDIKAEQDMKISFAYPEKSIILKIDYPISIEDKNSGASTLLRDHVIEFPVKYRQMYEFIMSSIDKESSDLDFTIKGTADFDVETIPDVHENNDLLAITDKHSLIKGEPFKLYIPIQNRYPVLYYVNNTEVDEQLNSFVLCQFEEGSEIIEPKIKINDNSITFENPRKCNMKSLSIDLNAKDPDDDTLTYYIVVDGKEYQEYSGLADSIEIHVSDGRLTDYQEIDLRTYRGGTNA